MLRKLIIAASCLWVFSQAVTTTEINADNQELVKKTITETISQWRGFKGGTESRFYNAVESIISCQKKYPIPNWFIKSDDQKLTLLQGDKAISDVDMGNCGYSEGSIYYRTILLSLRTPIKEFFIKDCRENCTKFRLIGMTKTYQYGNIYSTGGLGFYECVKMCSASYEAKKKNYKCFVLPLDLKIIKSTYHRSTSSDSLVNEPFSGMLF